MYESSFRLRGKTYDYKIQYSSIKKFFLLPKNDDTHTLIVLGLDPPLRQGQTRYPFLVMQLKLDEEISLELNMTELVFACFPLPSQVPTDGCVLASCSKRNIKTVYHHITKSPSTKSLRRCFAACPARRSSCRPRTLRV